MKTRNRLLSISLCISLLMFCISGCKPQEQGGNSSASSQYADSSFADSSQQDEVESNSSIDDAAVSSDNWYDDIGKNESTPDDNDNPKTPSQIVKKVNALKGQKYYSNFKTADVLYYVDISKTTVAMRDMLMSLQGIVAKKQSQIFLYDSSSHDQLWKETIENYYGIKMVEMDAWSLLEKFRSYITDNGFVHYEIYDENANYLTRPNAPSSVNVAAVIAGQKGYLMVDDSLVDEMKARGFVQRADALEFDQYDIFLEYQDQVNKKVFCSLGFDDHALLDTAIALGTMVWRESDASVLSDMLVSLGTDGVILGWHTEEGAGVGAGTISSWVTIASDSARNFSVYAGLPYSELKQKPVAHYAKKNNQNVHYVAFVMSDGDNACFAQSLATTDKYFANKSRGTVPFGWSLTPSAYEWMPNVAKHLYKTSTFNDNFIASVSGLGYMYPVSYPAGRLDEFTKKTAEYMKEMNMNYITLASQTPDGTVGDYVDSFAQWDQIKGGHFNEMGAGSVYVHDVYGGGVIWRNNKPFIFDRESLVLPNWGNNSTVTMDEVIEKMAYRLNNCYARNIYSIEGYTIINVHPWTATYDDVVKLTKSLNSDVVVVTPAELFELVTKNVPHTDNLDMSDKNMHSSFDYSALEASKKEDPMIPISTFNKMSASIQLEFDFSKGLQGWCLKAGSAALDQAYYNGTAILLGGSKFGTDTVEVNAEAYNKITLPNQNSLKMTYTVNYGGNKMRTLVVTSDNKVHVLSDWNTFKAGDVTTDLSQFKGQTVTILIQFRPGNLHGSKESISKIKIG